MGQLLSGHTCSMLALDKQSAYDIDSEECVSYRIYLCDTSAAYKDFDSCIL